MCRAFFRKANRLRQENICRGQNEGPSGEHEGNSRAPVERPNDRAALCQRWRHGGMLNTAGMGFFFVFRNTSRSPRADTPAEDAAAEAGDAPTHPHTCGEVGGALIRRHEPAPELHQHVSKQERRGGRLQARTHFQRSESRSGGQTSALVSRPERADSHPEPSTIASEEPATGPREGSGRQKGELPPQEP